MSYASAVPAHELFFFFFLLPVPFPLWLACPRSLTCMRMQRYPQLKRPWARTVKERDALVVSAAQFPNLLHSSAAAGHAVADAETTEEGVRRNEPEPGKKGGKRRRHSDANGKRFSFVFASVRGIIRVADVSRRFAAGSVTVPYQTPCFWRCAPISLAAAQPTAPDLPSEGRPSFAVPTDDAGFAHLQKRLEYGFMPSLIKVRRCPAPQTAVQCVPRNPFRVLVLEIFPNNQPPSACPLRSPSRSVQEFLFIVETMPAAPAPLEGSTLRYVERFLTLVIDLLTQLPTRRFLRLLLHDCNFILRCRRSSLAARAVGVPSLYTCVACAVLSYALIIPAPLRLLRPRMHCTHYIAHHADELRHAAHVASCTLVNVDTRRPPPASTSGVTAGGDGSSMLRSSNVHRPHGGRLFAQLLDMADFFLDFEIDDHTGAHLSEADVSAAQYTRLQVLQRLAYHHYADSSREMREFALSAVGVIAKPDTLRGYLDTLSDQQLTDLARRLRILPLPAYLASGGGGAGAAGAEVDSARTAKRVRITGEDAATAAAAGTMSGPSAATLTAEDVIDLEARVPQPPLSREYVMSVLLSSHARRASQLHAINSLPLYPSEALLWDANLVPSGRFAGDDVLALPKLNLQFLTLYDYLLRSFHLFRLESAYEIRADIVDAIKRVAPRLATVYNAAGYPEETTVFSGWARMAVPLAGFAVKEVAPPRIGEAVPAKVSAEITIDVAKYAGYIRAEWDALREHDVVFLITVRSRVPLGRHPDEYFTAPLAQPSGGRDGAAVGSSDGGVEGGDVEMAAAEPAAPAGAAAWVAGAGPQSTQQRTSSRDPGGTKGRAGGGRSGAKVPDEEDFTFPARYGIVAVRGCEVLEMMDEAGKVMNDMGGASRPGERQRAPTGTKRTLRVLLDPAQYHSDAVALASGAASGSVYDTFNLLLRRDPKTNNFKAVLETIRDVMNLATIGRAVPDWLHDIFLGYGDPAAAHYASLPPAVQLRDVDMRDTFLSPQHVIASFPGKQVVFRDEATGEALEPSNAALAPPFRIRFESGPAAAPAAAGSAAAPNAALSAASEQVVAFAYRPPPAGPFPEDQPRRNRVAFTPVQVEAIRSGLNPGLTLIVGPPGTGKTDTAVQIIANLYHNFPQQRILLVTHSNQALNDLFEKIMERDIPERHLLRLGAGERELETEKDFSKAGRVNEALRRRLAVLAEVDRLAVSLGIPGDAGYTCETAGYFHLYHVLSRIEVFRAKFNVPPPPPPASLAAAAASVASGAAAAAAARVAYRAAIAEKMAGVDPAAVADAFPFPAFFAAAPRGLAALFKRASAVEDLEAAEACFAHIDQMFDELASYRAFELLRSSRQRTDYMLTKQARIVAMTCTHAALTRSHLVSLGYRFDTLVMEEAAQVLEVETFIPMVLQDVSSLAAGPDGDRAAAGRLKRVVLLGDHHQLPPVVQNLALQKYARMEQSMFARFVRLGVPTVQLNAQGRARPPIAALYNWRYAQLGDLPRVLTGAEYRTANAGFVHELQAIDVGDFQGRGETTPAPHFYQVRRGGQHMHFGCAAALVATNCAAPARAPFAFAPLTA